MSAPIAMQPAAANDARTPRCPAYQTLPGAQAAAQRAARAESRADTCQPLTGVSTFGAYQATGAAAVFEVTLDTIGGDYLVKPVTLAEVARRQQASLRARIAGHLEAAKQYDADAAKSRMGSVKALFEGYARESRAKARDLEAQLTVSVARAS